MKKIILLTLILCLHSQADEEIKKIKAEFPRVQTKMVMLFNKFIPHHLKADDAKIFSSGRAEKLGTNGVVSIYTLPDNYDIKDPKKLKKATDYILKSRDDMARMNKNDRDMKLLLKAGFIVAYRLEHKGKTLKEEIIGTEEQKK